MVVNLIEFEQLPTAYSSKAKSRAVCLIVVARVYATGRMSGQERSSPDV